MRACLPRLRTAVLAAGLGVPGLAVAAEPRTGGMPQLDFANPLTIAQIVWLAIIFAVLYVLVSRWALPQLGAVIDAREGVIRRDLEAARQAKDEADAAVRELNEAGRAAGRQGQEAISRALAEARAAAADQARVLAERLDAQVGLAEARIAEARASAMGALRDVANDTAVTLIERLTGRPPTRERVDAAVVQAMAGAPAAGRG